MHPWCVDSSWSCYQMAMLLFKCMDAFMYVEVCVWVADEGCLCDRSLFFDLSLFQPEDDEPRLPPFPSRTILHFYKASWGDVRGKKMKTTNYLAIETNRGWETWPVANTAFDRKWMQCGIKRQRDCALQLLWQLRCNLGITVIVCWRGWHFKSGAGRLLRPWRTKKL